MGASPYDIGIPMDVEQHLRRMGDIVECNVSEIAHALMRDSLNRITQGQRDLPADEYAAAVKTWQKTMGLTAKKAKPCQSRVVDRAVQEVNGDRDQQDADDSISSSDDV